MVLYLFIVFGSLLVLTGSALVALRWAARTGQLRHFQKTALSIFDEEEPVGRMTDFFPGQRPAGDSFGVPPPGGPTRFGVPPLGGSTPDTHRLEAELQAGDRLRAGAGEEKK